MLIPDMKLSSLNKQYGLAMVEMVVVTPLLLFLMFSVAELGRAFYQYNTLTKSVLDGARYLSMGAKLGTTGVIDLTVNGGEIINKTKNVVIYGNQAGVGDPVIEDLTVDSITVTALDAMHIQVSVSYPYQSMFGGTIPSFGMGTGEINSNFNLTANSVMRAMQ